MRRRPAWLLLALTACGGPERAHFSPCDVRQESCQAATFAAVEQLRGQLWHPGLPPTPVVVVTRQQHRDRLARMRPDFQSGGAANLWSGPLRRLGLLSPTLNAADADLRWNAENAIANYWPASKLITIIDERPRFDDAAAVETLVHEYLHAAQDREFALGYFGPSTTDAELMRTSFIEGEAEVYATIARLQMEAIAPDTFDWTGHYRARLLGVRGLVPQAESPHTEVRRWMPYDLGGAFMARAWQRGGTTGVNRAYFDSPRASVQLMKSMEGLSIDLPAPVPPCPPSLDGARFTLQASDTLGAALFYAFLARFAAQENDAWQAALSWQADRIWAYAVAGGGVVSLWRVHAPGLRATPVGAVLAARTTPPVLVGDDLLDWPDGDAELSTTLRRGFDCAGASPPP